MKRPAFCAGLAIFLFVSLNLFEIGCTSGGGPGLCAPRWHPDHVDEYGKPDPCCLSNAPCCTNPLWG
jgi:hypothetical protein